MKKLIALTAVMVLAGPAIAVEAAPTNVAGIWKMCYQPGLEDVVEIDEGYLALLPDGSYYRIGRSCCAERGEPDTPSSEIGSFRLDGAAVVLTPEGEGTEKARRLNLDPDVRAVFFDDPKGEAVSTQALHGGDTIDYGYCRIYP